MSRYEISVEDFLIDVEFFLICQEGMVQREHENSALASSSFSDKFASRLMVCDSSKRWSQPTDKFPF